MKIQSTRLNADHLRVELDAAEGRTHCLEVEHSGGVTGALEQGDEGLRLRDVHGQMFHLVQLVWWFGGSVLRIEQASELADLAVDLHIPKRKGSVVEGETLNVRANAGTARLRSARLELEGLTLTGDVVLEGLQVVQRGSDTLLQIRHLECHRLHVFGTDAAVAVDEVQADDVWLELSSHKEPMVRVGTIRASAVAATVGNREIIASGVVAPRGVEMTGAVVYLPELTCPEARLRLPDFGGPSNGAADRNPPSQSSTLDTSFLDALTGHAFFDVDVDVTVPIIKTRRATHRFRLQVERGTVSFHDVEEALAELEDAVLDFRVTDHALELVKDVPLVPFDTRTLVSWPLLHEEDHDLAAEGLVRLRTLSRYQLPASAKSDGDGEASAVSIRRIDVEQIDVALKLATPARMQMNGATLSFGADGRTGLGELRVVGDVRYDGEGKAEGERASHLRVDVRELDVGIENLFLGSALVQSALVSVASIESARVELAGVAPSAADGVARGLSLSELRLLTRPNTGAAPSIVAEPAAIRAAS